MILRNPKSRHVGFLLSTPSSSSRIRQQQQQQQRVPTAVAGVGLSSGNHHHHLMMTPPGGSPLSSSSPTALAASSQHLISTLVGGAAAAAAGSGSGSSQLVAATADAATSTGAATAMNPLVTFFVETLITNGVPALFTIAVIAFAVKAFRGSSGDGRDRRGGRGSGSNADRFMTGTYLESDTPVAQLYNDYYGDQNQDGAGGRSGGGPDFGKLFGGGPGDGAAVKLPKNVGVPGAEYFKITDLNRKYDSYQFTVSAATQSKAAAAAAFRQKSFNRAWDTAAAVTTTNGQQQAVTSTSSSSATSLEPYRVQQLQNAEQRFLRDGNDKIEKIRQIQTALTQIVVDDQIENVLGMQSVYELDGKEANATTTEANDEASSMQLKQKKQKKKSGSAKAEQQHQLQELGVAQKELQQLELNFIKDVIQVVGPTRAAAVRTALLGDIASRGSGGLLTNLQQRPLMTLLRNGQQQTSNTATIVDVETDATTSSTGGTVAPTTTTAMPHQRPIVYVTRFVGDVQASQVDDLREVVTAIIQQSKQGDEVLVVLQTGGGTVTGYGLAAAQLMRIKQAGLRLTIAVEQVAASGGYMMCCVADKIIASPFAVLGSIGVISEIPNVYERLKQEGVEFQSITAGKYKRTLTPTKKVTREDYEKSKADVEDILTLFRDFVHEQRPHLDIDKVATGETWFGNDALERNLCDEINTVDDVLLSDYINQGYDAYEIEYKPPDQQPLDSFGRLLPFGSSPNSNSRGGDGMVSRGIRWLVQSVASEIKAELGVSGSSSSIKERYMAKDDTADQIKSID